MSFYKVGSWQNRNLFLTESSAEYSRGLRGPGVNRGDVVQEHALVHEDGGEVQRVELPNARGLQGLRDEEAAPDRVVLRADLLGRVCGGVCSATLFMFMSGQS